MIIGSVSDIASVSGKDTWHVREAAPPLGPAKAGGGGKSKSGGMIVGLIKKERWVDAQMLRAIRRLLVASIEKKTKFKITNILLN